MKTFGKLAKAKLQLYWLANSALISITYPFDYPFKTDIFSMYPLMGKTEPDIDFTYSLRC